MRSRKLLIGFLIGFVLVMLSVAALAFWLDPNIFKGRLETAATSAFGRKVELNGRISFTLSLRPRIVVRELNIANERWASKPYLARIEQLELQLALWPLFLGEFKALGILFSGAEVFLEKNAGGADNFTFGDAQADDTAGALPDIGKFHVRDANVTYQSASGEMTHYWIEEASVRNIPGKPERIKGNGTIKGMPFSVLLVSESAAELATVQNPWRVKLEVEGSGMRLNLDGRMARPFTFQEIDYRIHIKGTQTDSLEKLLEVDIPSQGSFEIGTRVQKSGGKIWLSDLTAHLQGPEGTPAIRVLDGQGTGGLTEPIQLSMKGQYGDKPFACHFKTERSLKDLPLETPWPMEGQLKVADAQINARGTMTLTASGEVFEVDGHLQGKTFNLIEHVFGIGPPQTGPYEFTYQVHIAEGNYRVRNIQGQMRDIGPWKSVRIKQGQVTSDADGRLRGSVEGRFDDLPMTLAFEGGPTKLDTSGQAAWPIKLAASAAGVNINAEGAIITSQDKGEIYQVKTQVKSRRFESLGKMLGISLPALGAAHLAAQVRSDDDSYEITDLKARVGASDLAGNLKWQQKDGRPFLTGALSSENLMLKTLTSSLSKSGPQPPKDALLNQAVSVEWLDQFDADLELKVKRLKGGRFPTEKVEVAVTMIGGDLEAPFDAKIAGGNMAGEIKLGKNETLPAVSVKAKIENIELGPIFDQLDIFEEVEGSAGSISLVARSQGKVLHEMLSEADITLEIKPAELIYKGQFFPLLNDSHINSAVLAARHGRPIQISASGTVQELPIDFNIETGAFNDIFRADKPVPVRISVISELARLDIKGRIDKLFENQGINLNYEMKGQEIERIDPLVNFAFPVRGAFHIKGQVTDKDDHYLFTDQARIGNSDIAAVTTYRKRGERLRINIDAYTKELHTTDFDLFDKDVKKKSEDEQAYLIPNYTLPLAALRKTDMTILFKADKILFKDGDLNDMVFQYALEDGHIQSSLAVTGMTGAGVKLDIDINAKNDPPQSKLALAAEEVDYGLILEKSGLTDMVSGRIDIYAQLSGEGATRRDFLASADGYVSLIGGSGLIASKKFDLWAADLTTVMLSPEWQRQDETNLNCAAGRIQVKGGTAEIHDLVLDTERITIAGSGVLELGSEELNIFIAPRPKKTSLVSLAYPVKVTGTLADPDIQVVKLGKKRQLAASGVLAGFINPAFLLLGLGSLGSGQANPCMLAIENAYAPLHEAEQ